ncbi:MAG: 2Fe-2S iron-sulfur cluster-binding protein [Thermoanaerobaculales bacterium]
MITLTINGNEVRVAEGSNIVEAARKAGVEIPTYCYHPGLSVVGQCRICFVEIEGMPRLVTACSTPVQDGMVVFTNSDRVCEARAAVMEFLLENHPLDCPVCDQAGECGLQDYSVEHGLDTTHMVDERRRFPGFERRQIGPHVVQNQNRCIHCTRCIRFTEEIAETADLTMKSRGNHSFIDTFDGTPLDNPWSACVADVCPVGALTVKEFRFRARVWRLEETASLCPGCSIGCNVHVGHLKGIVHRFVPRLNREVNGWWMCDYGRLLADGLNVRQLDQPQERGTGPAKPLSWTNAITRVGAMLQSEPEARVVASANFSNGALFLVKRALVDGAGLEVVVPVHTGEERRVKNSRGEWVISNDAHPNSTGARRLDLAIVDGDGLESFIRQGDGPVLVLDADAHPWLASDAAAETVAGREVAVLGRTETPLTAAASLVLPLASWAETEGSYTSSTGRVQLAQRAVPPKGQARPAWEVLFRLAVELGIEEERTVSPRTLFAELAAVIPAFAGMTFGRMAAEPGMPVIEEVTGVG